MTTQRAKDIITKIKQDKITPVTYVSLRWKSWVFWSMWGLIMIVGAISFSLLILNMLDIRMFFFAHLGLGRYIKILFLTAPYLWLGLSLIALVSGYVALRKTHRGYRYGVLFITSLSVLVIMLLGAVVHMSKMNDRIGKGIAGGLPRGMVFPIEGRMHKPEHGILGGRITSVRDDAFILEGVRGEQWRIMYDEKTRIDLETGLVVNALVEVIGRESGGDNVFYAKVVRMLPDRMPPFLDDETMKGEPHVVPRDAIGQEDIRPFTNDEQNTSQE